MAFQDENKLLVRKYFEAYDKQDAEQIGKLVSNSYCLHIAGMQTMDWTATKQFFKEEVWRAFPDLHHEILDLVSEGGKVSIRYNSIGTHKGKFREVVATGKEVSFSTMAFITLIDGKVAEEWVVADTEELMRQIGEHVR